MIYDPAEHPFSDTHKLMIGSIVPRPIALVSTTSINGINNLAPFSYFNGVCSKPPTIMFAPARRGWDGEEKDTLINIRETKEFTVNIVSEKIGEQMVKCSTDFKEDIDEFIASGLSPSSSKKIKPPLVAETKISFECKLNQIIEIGDGNAGSAGSAGNAGSGGSGGSGGAGGSGNPGSSGSSGTDSDFLKEQNDYTITVGNTGGGTITVSWPPQ